MSKPRLPKRTYPAGSRHGSVGWHGSPGWHGSVGAHGSVGMAVVTPAVRTPGKKTRIAPPSSGTPTLTPVGVLRAVIPSWLTAKLWPPTRIVLERADPLLTDTL